MRYAKPHQLGGAIAEGMGAENCPIQPISIDGGEWPTKFPREQMAGTQRGSPPTPGPRVRIRLPPAKSLQTSGTELGQFASRAFAVFLSRLASRIRMDKPVARNSKLTK